MRDINYFFAGESGMAWQFHQDTIVTPTEDAKRIAVDYANQSKWISVNEALPKLDKFYLVNIRDSAHGTEWITKLDFASGAWIAVNLNNATFVTHWQELPSAPL